VTVEGPTNDQIPLRLVTSAAMLVRLVNRELPADVTPTTAGVMAALEERPHRIGELVELEGLAQPTLTALVGALERRGWVERSKDASDGRAVWVSLTQAGRERKRQLHEEVAAMVRDRLASVPEQQLASLSETVENLELIVRAMRDSPPNPDRRSAAA
jgi:DNA-binding MarR family transcriptional regulator